MADLEREVRTEKVMRDGTAVEKQSITRRNSDEKVVKGQKIVYLIYGILAGLLAIRFIFSLLGANRSNAFADLIYTVTGPFVAPFRGLFNVNTDYGVSRLDIESLVAIIVYGLIAWVIVKMLGLGKKSDTAV